mmetsp:Transcript_13839/g.20259  ORF Transcript_13839/g.20259 Transcript_13839/m.20259 type:complete len:131 (-) Transcript_13839:51-443(-)
MRREAFILLLWCRNLLWSNCSPSNLHMCGWKGSLVLRHIRLPQCGLQPFGDEVVAADNDGSSRKFVGRRRIERNDGGVTFLYSFLTEMQSFFRTTATRYLQADPSLRTDDTQSPKDILVGAGLCGAQLNR